MKAVILAGGKGTRMAPYTTVLPKPLLPVGGMPILEIVIRQLKSAGIRDIVISVGYLGSLVEAYFGDGRKWGVKITYSYEGQPLGTAAPIGRVKGLKDSFLVMNGDVLTTINYRKMAEFHKRHGELITVGLANKKIKIDLGVVETNNDNTLRDYIEKPTLDYLISMGVYILEPEILGFIKKNERLDLPELVLRLIRNNKKVITYRSDCIWLDIGRPEDFMVASDIFQKHRASFIKG